MLVDKLMQFSDAQAVTSAAGSTSTIDLGEARDLGTGNDLYVVAVVTTAFTDAGSNSTLTVALEGDSTESFTPDGTRDLFVFPALSAVGDTLIAKLSPGSEGLQYRYVRLKYTPNNGDLTSGSITAYLTDNAHRVKLFAKNYTIS